MAALSANSHGARVHLVERSRFPKHKVCGEFLSPEIAPVVERLGLAAEFFAAGPARIHRASIHIGRKCSGSRLPAPAYGLSRYAFDALLYKAATAAGEPFDDAPAVTIFATGRDTRDAPRRGDRLFGFKAHFDGPQDDTVELYFFDDWYVGLNPIEGGGTNVCGLGPERALCNFEIDELLSRSPELRARLAPLTRKFEWLFAGPLIFRNKLRETIDEASWPAGDALSFIDPFTGTGLLSALITGELAGRFAAEGRSVAEYLQHSRRAIEKPFAFSSVLRRAAGLRISERLIGLVPPSVLFRLTRPTA